MRIELCIDLDATDMDLLLKVSRALGMPIDALVKTSIASFITKTFSPQASQPQPAQPSKAEEKKEG
jgi:hypothetical protein